MSDDVKEEIQNLKHEIEKLKQRNEANNNSNGIVVGLTAISFSVVAAVVCILIFLAVSVTVMAIATAEFGETAIYGTGTFGSFEKDLVAAGLTGFFLMLFAFMCEYLRR
jgi:hypothetical protein